MELRPLRAALTAAAFAIGFSWGATAETTPPAPVGAPVAPPAATAPAPVEAITPAIWTLAKPNGGTITFFGSVHILPEGPDWRTPAVRTAFDGAETIVLETPLAETQEQAFQTYILQNGTNPQGTTLRGLLSEADRVTYDQAMGVLGAPIEALDAFRPWLASLTMTVIFAQKQGYSPESGVDTQVEKAGRLAGKQFAFFESPKEQIDFFINLPPAVEQRLLTATAKDLVERPEQLGALIDAWKKGDTKALDDLMNSAMSTVPEVDKLLLQDRNTRWVERIQKEFMADAKDYFIVVGAGHLVGGDSVIAMLRAKGLKIEGP